MHKSLFVLAATCLGWLLAMFADKVNDGTVDLRRIGRLRDEQVVEQLTQVKGIGRWTAQMFLIFSLGRPDVFPHDDLGVRTAIRDRYGLTDLPDKEMSHAIVALLVCLPLTAQARDYQSDGQISRPVLQNYLSRSITMLDLLTGHGNVEDNIRMLRNVDAKFAGRSIYLWGQAEIMDGNDPDHVHWGELLQRVRAYAKGHARRHWVLCDAHVPSGGMLYGDRLLFDFHSFPLRIVEVPDRPQEGILQVGAVDSIYGRSMGGIAPSDWRCEHLPYLVELDNWGVSDRPGKPGLGGCWVWGYDEISWFAHQDEPYRNRWLRYAWDWVREHDPNGFLQMPGSRVLHAPVDGQSWYYANTRSEAVPSGFSQEETIKAIWSEE